eukprot:m.264774 g.264774  ORF g.264774 m.264774 type:complete len:379 (+) comp19252_c0_seq4:3671-4807(+)
MATESSDEDVAASSATALDEVVQLQEERIEFLEDMVESLVATCQELEGMVKTCLQAVVHSELTNTQGSSVDLAGVKAAAGTMLATFSNQTLPALPSTKRLAVPPMPSPLHTPSGSRDRLMTDFSKTDASTTTDEAPIYGRCYGYLAKQSGSVAKQWKRRWYLLKNDFELRYYKTAKASTQATADHGKVDLTGYTIQKAPEISKPHAFKAVCLGKKTLQFVADNEDDQLRWMAALSEAAEKLTAAEIAMIETAKRVNTERDRILRERGVSSEQLSVSTAVKGASKHGYLKRQTATGTWSRLYFVLQDDILHYFGSENSSSALGAVWLQGHTVSKGDDHVLMLSHPGTRTFTIKALSESDFAQWHAKLSEAAEAAVQTNC